jgi:hypothetical protein
MCTVNWLPNGSGTSIVKCMYCYGDGRRGLRVRTVTDQHNSVLLIHASMIGVHRAHFDAYLHPWQIYVDRTHFVAHLHQVKMHPSLLFSSRTAF